MHKLKGIASFENEKHDYGVAVEGCRGVVIIENYLGGNLALCFWDSMA